MKRDSGQLYSSTMLDMIDNIVEVVVNTYFYWVDSVEFREDLMQEGYLKAYELLKTGNYDPNQNLRNYIFTGVRNAMTNLNYHNNKEKHSSYDVYQDNVKVDDYEALANITSHTNFSDFRIDTNIIIKSCKKYNIKYLGNAINYFYHLGVHDASDVNMVEDVNPIVLRAIIVDVMWQLGG